MLVKYLYLVIVLFWLTGCNISSNERVTIIEKSDNLQNINQYRLTSEPEDVQKIKKTTYKTIQKKTSKLSSWFIPVNAKVLKFFSTKDNHLGLTFNTQAGQKVYAVRDGKVTYVFSGTNNKDKIIKIHHLFGFYSVYTNNKDLLITKGEKVKKGQVISLTSQVPFYFEMKKFKTSIDPLKYLQQLD